MVHSLKVDQRLSSKPLATSHPLSLVVIDTLRAAGLIREDGSLKAREAQRAVKIPRNTLRRRIESGDFTVPELDKIATAAGTTSEELVAKARGAAA